jgi:hypothetical protein
VNALPLDAIQFEQNELLLLILLMIQTKKFKASQPTSALWPSSSNAVNALEAPDTVNDVRFS